MLIFHKPDRARRGVVSKLSWGLGARTEEATVVESTRIFPTGARANMLMYDPKKKDVVVNLGGLKVDG